MSIGRTARIIAAMKRSNFWVISLAVVVFLVSCVSCQATKANQSADEAWQAYGYVTEHFIRTFDHRELLAEAWTETEEVVVQAGGDRDQLPDIAANVPSTQAEFQDTFAQMLAAGHGHIARTTVETAFIEAMARNLRSNHTAFIRPVEWDAVNKGKELGFGDTDIAVPEGRLVWSVEGGSSAAKAGLMPGDIVTRLNGQPLTSSIRPPKAGEKDQIDVIRPGIGQVKLTLKAEAAARRIYSQQMLAGNIAYLRLFSMSTMGPGCGNSLDKPETHCGPFGSWILDSILLHFETFSPHGWIIDLRNDPGGSGEIAASLALRMGLKVPVAEYHYSNGSIGAAQAPSQAFSNDSRAYVSGNEPIVILVNRRTGSAAEIVAAVFQQTGRGHIIGERTAGAVELGTFYPVAGGALEVAVARVLVGPQKTDIDGSGVLPDELVSLDSESLAAGHDTQLEHAIAYIEAHAR